MLPERAPQRVVTSVRTHFVKHRRACRDRHPLPFIVGSTCTRHSRSRGRDSPPPRRCPFLRRRRGRRRATLHPPSSRTQSTNVCGAKTRDKPANPSWPSIASVAENAQHEPHSPWSRTGGHDTGRLPIINGERQAVRSKSGARLCNKCVGRVVCRVWQRDTSVSRHRHNHT